LTRDACPSLCSYCSADLRDLRSFPTRRSSDLPPAPEGLTLSTYYYDGAAQIIASWDPVPFLGDVRYEVRYRRASTSVWSTVTVRSEEHTSELQSRENLVCRLLLEKKKRTEHTS